MISTEFISSLKKFGILLMSALKYAQGTLHVEETNLLIVVSNDAQKARSEFVNAESVEGLGALYSP